MTIINMIDELNTTISNLQTKIVNLECELEQVKFQADKYEKLFNMARDERDIYARQFGILEELND